MSYTVVAPLVIAQDKEGHYHHVYQGGVIAWLNPAQKKNFLAEKLVEESGTADADADDGDEVPDESWKRDEIDAWAAENLELDTTGEANKADALALIAEHLDNE